MRALAGFIAGLILATAGVTYASRAIGRDPLNPAALRRDIDTLWEGQVVSNGVLRRFRKRILKLENRRCR